MANAQKFINNVQLQITEFLDASDTTITVSSTGALLPLTDGDFYIGTIVPTGGLSTLEIIKITAVNISNQIYTLTVLRGQEGTAPQNYLYGSQIELRVTAGAFNNFAQTDEVVEEVVAIVTPILTETLPPIITPVVLADVEAEILPTQLPNFYSLGGRGDFGTDNSVALQTMLTNTTNQGWYINSGVYLFNTGVVSDYSSGSFPIIGARSPRAALHGENMANTIFAYTGTGLAIQMNGSLSGQGLNSLDTYSDFLLSCGNGNKSNNGLYLKNRAQFRFDNIYFQYFDAACQVDACYTGVFNNCHFESSNNGLSFLQVSGEAPNLIQANNCTFNRNTAWGAQGNVNAAISFDSCDFSACGSMAAPTTSGAVNLNITAPLSGPISFDNCYFEINAGLADANIANSSGGPATVIFKNCTFNRELSGTFTTNNIRGVNFGSGSTLKIIMQGCSFVSNNSYTPSGGRPFLNGDTLTEFINEGCAFSETTSLGNRPMTHGRVMGGIVAPSATSYIAPPQLTITATATGTISVVHNTGFGFDKFAYIATAVSNDTNDVVKVQEIQQISATQFFIILTDTSGARANAGCSFQVLQLY